MERKSPIGKIGGWIWCLEHKAGICFSNASELQVIKTKSVPSDLRYSLNLPRPSIVESEFFYKFSWISRLRTGASQWNEGSWGLFHTIAPNEIKICSFPCVDSTDPIQGTTITLRISFLLISMFENNRNLLPEQNYGRYQLKKYMYLKCKINIISYKYGVYACYS